MNSNVRVGSIPTRSTKNGLVAQGTEQYSSKVPVVGSNPTGFTKWWGRIEVGEKVISL